MKKTPVKKQVSKSKAPVKKTPAKKPVAKAPAKKPVAKAPAKKVASKAPAKKAVAKKTSQCQKKCACKNDANKKCCNKGNCKCKKNLEKAVAEIFPKLNDVSVVESIIQDFFFLELVDAGYSVEEANAMADKIIVNVESLDATINLA